MKKILITTSGERNTRILLRTELFKLLKKEYEIIIASPAEQSTLWKDEFKDVTFFSTYCKNDVDKKDVIKNLNLSAIISCNNTDTPSHVFDINFQKICKELNIPIIIVQDFIDAIFHPMVVKPDLYLCWGEFFKRIYSRKRDVMQWHSMGSMMGMAVEEPLPNVKICGVPHFDSYRKFDYYTKEKFVSEIGFAIDKPIFTYLPNGELSQWVFDTFDNFMEVARKFNGQVIIKSHPIRTDDRWIYNLIIKNYKDVPTTVLLDPSTFEGTAIGLKSYDCNIYHMDDEDQFALGNVLINSDICCSIPSTTAIEAMMFNKPVVLETMYWTHPWKIRVKVMNWYWDVLEAYKCCDISKKQDDLFQYVKENMDNPDKNKVGRAHIVQDFFNVTGGGACLNMFNEVKKFLG